jgi:hypothetical protein
MVDEGQDFGNNITQNQGPISAFLPALARNVARGILCHVAACRMPASAASSHLGTASGAAGTLVCCSLTGGNIISMVHATSDGNHTAATSQCCQALLSPAQVARHVPHSGPATGGASCGHTQHLQQCLTAYSLLQAQQQHGHSCQALVSTASPAVDMWQKQHVPCCDADEVVVSTSKAGCTPQPCCCTLCMVVAPLYLVPSASIAKHRRSHEPHMNADLALLLQVALGQLQHPSTPAQAAASSPLLRALLLLQADEAGHLHDVA